MYNILNYGASSTPDSINTDSIQAAVNDCNEHGGGIVYCPAGVFLTGTIWLKSNVTLHLENGCVLKACTDKNEYNTIDCFPERDIVAHQNANGTHLIIAYKVDNIAITGKGRIDGNCDSFFTDGKFEHKDFPRHYVYNLPDERPGQMLYFCRSTNISINDVARDKACFWTVYMLGCENISISGVSIEILEVPNGDGLHFNCCRNIIVSNCNINSQDDCLIFRGHYSPLGENIPCENIVVSNCLLRTKCCAFRIGVGDGLIRNCQFSNSVIHDTRTGISIIPAYSKRYPRGTDIDNINFSNITMDVRVPIMLCNPGVADLRNINFSNLKVNMTLALIIIGEEKNKWHGITVSNSIFNIKKGLRQISGIEHFAIPECSLFIKNADDFRMQNSQVKFQQNIEDKIESVLYIENSNKAHLDNIDFCNYRQFADTDIITV